VLVALPALEERTMKPNSLVIGSAAVLSLLAGISARSPAQGTQHGLGRRVMLGVSTFGSPRGVQPALHLGYSAARPLGGNTSLGLVVDVQGGLWGGEEASCVGPGPCLERSTWPGLVLGLTTEVRHHPGEGRFGLVIGAGLATAPDAKGAVTKTSGVVSTGADYEFGDTGSRPVIGVRFTRMLTNVVSVEWIVAPVVAIRF
jgi:hypothetical protein